MTPRQQEAANLAARGMTYQEIADELGISRMGARKLIATLAQRLPEDGTRPMFRVQRWMWTHGNAA